MFKYLLLSLCLPILSYASTDNANTSKIESSTTNQDGIEGYLEDGEKIIIPAGNYKLKDLGQIKSIKIPANYEIIFSNSPTYDSPDSKSYPTRSTDNSNSETNTTLNSLTDGKSSVDTPSSANITSNGDIDKNLTTNKQENNSTENKNNSTDGKQENISASTNNQYNLSEIGKFTYLYVAKLDNSTANGIAIHTDYDLQNKRFFGRGLINVPDINEKVEKIIIDNSPELKELPNLTKYKNLKSIELLLDTFKNKENIQEDLDKIFNYIANGHILNNIEIQKSSNPYCKLIGTKFFAFNLDKVENIPSNITELYLINSNLEIDFSKYYNLSKIALFGSTLSNLDNTKWQEKIKQIYNLRNLTWLLLPPSFTGTIPAHPNPSRCKLEYIGAENAITVAKNAFYKCYYLKEIYFPNMKTVSEMAFSNCTRLKIANMPKVEIIEQKGFDWCYSLEKFGVVSRDINGVYAPELKTIARAAFHQDDPYPAKWKEIILPKCERIDYDGFCRPGPLVTLVAPKCKFIGTNAFYDCKYLKEVTLPNIEKIEPGAFLACYSLETLNLPKCQFIGNNAFQEAYRLRQLNLPVIKYIGVNAFRGSRVTIPTRH